MLRLNVVETGPGVGGGVPGRVPRAALSAAAARAFTVSMNPWLWPLNRPSAVKEAIVATGPAFPIDAGRITEQGGRSARRNWVGSGMIRFVCRISSPLHL